MCAKSIAPRWPICRVFAATVLLAACGAPPQDEAQITAELAAADAADGYDPVETVEVTVYDYPMGEETTESDEPDAESPRSGLRQIIIRHYPPGYDLSADEAETLEPESGDGETTELELGDAHTE